MLVLRVIVCVFSFLVIKGYGDPEVAAGVQTGDGELIAVVSYKGGFQQNLMGDVKTKSLVKYFRVDVPAFCGGVEVLEAATVSEGVKDAAKRVGDPKALVFQVAGGSPMRLGSVVLSLNGPEGVACSIPVYARESVGGGGGLVGGEKVVNRNVRFCNSYRRDVHVAIAYEGASGWKIEGWKNLGRGQCINPITAEPLTGKIYSYAYSDGLVVNQWGTETYFCVGLTPTFKVTNDDCRAGTPGTQWQVFSSHPLLEKGVVTVTYR